MTKKLLYDAEPPNFGPDDFETFMIWSTKQGTSDVTIQNEDNIICEIHGNKLRVTKRKLTKAELINIIGSIYKSEGAMSKLNSGEDVDIPWNIKINRDEVLRYRVNMTGVFTEGYNGYSLTIRTISSRPVPLESLNLPQEMIDNLSPREGLILMVGATGSGKSTFLAAVLDWRMRKPDANLKVLTYEHPIEYVYDEVIKPSSIISQSEIGTHLPSFSAGVRNALRRKPDIILLGELRDRETIGEAIIASQTGHLVYGTLHAIGVAVTINRMVNNFVPEEKHSKASDILSTIKMIIAQKLIRSTDGKRIAIREYLIFTEDIKNQLMEVSVDKLSYHVGKMLKLYGQTFLQDATLKFEEGLISEEEFLEVKKETEGAKKNINTLIIENQTLDEKNDIKTLKEEIEKLKIQITLLEAEEVNEVQEVNEVEEIKEVNEVEEIKEVNEVEEIKEVNEVEEIKAVNEVEEIKDVKEVEEIKAVNEVEEIKDVKEVEEIKDVNEVEEIKDVKEVEEIKDVKEVEEIKEVKEVEEIKAVNEVEEIKEVKEVSKNWENL